MNPSSTGLLRETTLVDHVDVEPLHLSITNYFSTGNSSNLHVLYDGDLGIGGRAGDIVHGSTDGALLIALSVDGDHDEIHWVPTGGADAIEMLTRGLESMETALTAARKVAQR